MSKFTIEEARRLAALTFRYRPENFDTPDAQIQAGKANRPLLGKEDKLLAALQPESSGSTIATKKFKPSKPCESQTESYLLAAQNWQHNSPISNAI